MDQQYYVDIVPFKHRNGNSGIIKKQFVSANTLETITRLNNILQEFQTDKKFLNPKYSNPSLACQHPALGHDVMTEPFVHLKKYHRHHDGGIYLTYVEFEPSYGEFPSAPGLTTTASLLRR